MPFNSFPFGNPPSPEWAMLKDFAAGLRDDITQGAGVRRPAGTLSGLLDLQDDLRRRRSDFVAGEVWETCLMLARRLGWEGQPFTLAVKFDAPAVAPGKPAPLTVTVTRAPGFTGEVALSAAGLPPNVKAALKNVPAGQNTAQGQLDIAAAVKPGQYTITVTGKAKHQGRDVSVNAAPVPLVLKK